MTHILFLHWYWTWFYAVGTCAEFFRFANHKNNTGGDTYRLFKLNYFILGFLAFSIIITGVSTSLIILRILSATQGNPAIGSRAPYQKIQCIIIASGAIYLFGLVITVIPLALVSYMASAPQTRFYSPAFVPSSIILMYSQPLLIPLAVSYGFMCGHHLWTYILLQGISPTLIALRVITQKPEAESDDSPPTSRLTFRRTIQRTHTPAIGSLVSSLHFESTWEAEDLVTGTSCMADGDDGITVEGLDGGEQIRLQKAWIRSRGLYGADIQLNLIDYPQAQGCPLASLLVHICWSKGALWRCSVVSCFTVIVSLTLFAVVGPEFRCQWNWYGPLTIARL